MEKTTKDEFGSGSYTTHVYVVEGRTSHGEVVLKLDEHGGKLGNLILNSHEWKRVPVEYAPVGVPNRLEFYAEAAAHRFMTYECAMAIACWLQATQDYGGILTRVAQIEFTSSYSTSLQGYSQPLDLHEDALQLLRKFQADRKRELAQSVDAVREEMDQPVVSTRV